MSGHCECVCLDTLQMDDVTAVTSAIEELIVFTMRKRKAKDRNLMLSNTYAYVSEFALDSRPPVLKSIAAVIAEV